LVCTGCVGWWFALAVLDALPGVISLAKMAALDGGPAADTVEPETGISFQNNTLDLYSDFLGTNDAFQYFNNHSTINKTLNLNSIG
jgi:hypothetical protein